MFPANPILLLGLLITLSCLVLRFLFKTSVLPHVFKQQWRLIEDGFHVYQFFRVPQFNEHMQENQLYRKISAYLNSLPSAVEDSDFANLFSGSKPNEINLVLDQHRRYAVIDTFLSARVYWMNEECEKNGSKSLVLKIRRNDKRRILRPYLHHIRTVIGEHDQERKELRLYVNAEAEPERNGRWRSVPFTHPSTFETLAMDSDLKNKVKSDLESFLKSRQYYHRLGRVWRRSYLLYGPSGTGKSSFVAGMAKFLCYDVYDVDLTRVSDDSDLKMLLLQTTNKSMIVVEDLDRYLSTNSTAVSLSGILNFMDGILSFAGEERVMVFTMNGKDRIDPAVLRPGRIDVHIQFRLCDFSNFKAMASSYLGVKEHKLFPRVEEMFQTGSGLSPAEIGEIMISNRTSPSRALKSVMAAMQNSGGGDGGGGGRNGRGSSEGRRVVEECGDSGSFFCREGGGKEFRKLYGLLRSCSNSSTKEESMNSDSAEKQKTWHGSMRR